MKSFLVVLTMCIMGLTTLAEAKDKAAPWSTMAPKEKAMYEKEFKCDEASTVMKLVVQWPVTGSTPVVDGIYTKMYTLDDTSNAVVMYKPAKKGNDIPVMALVTVGEVSMLAVEFNYVKHVLAVVDSGKSPEDVTVAEGTKHSTGEYFCYAN